ncbi:hypothetical protein AAFF_G00211250 [Aldrovandia affinis]|uniref:Uncharacterized protein n=1 Tax=Aldrovandia affinis TaxID=143900 RepID=A0AAD7WVS9_9TELE|nr:hypothetical protein AAFF_G00211250 [Aldrovandia affinis]
MGLMNADYFMDSVKSNPLVKESDKCHPIIVEGMKALFDYGMNRSHPNLNSMLSRPRLPFAILLAMGGWSGSIPTNAIESYDSRAGCWVNVTQETESPRAYHGAVYLNGFVYCLGGYNSITPGDSTATRMPSRDGHEARAQLAPKVATLQAVDGEAGWLPLTPSQVQEEPMCEVGWRQEDGRSGWTLPPSMLRQRLTTPSGVASRCEAVCCTGGGRPLAGGPTWCSCWCPVPSDHRSCSWCMEQQGCSCL